MTITQLLKNQKERDILVSTLHCAARQYEVDALECISEIGGQAGDKLAAQFRQQAKEATDLATAIMDCDE